MQKNARKLKIVNERGYLIGESHPRAQLTDHEIALLCELRDQGFSFGWLAKKFEIGKSTAFNLYHGKRRAQLAAGVKR